MSKKETALAAENRTQEELAAESTEQEKPAAREDAARVYCGPSVRGVVRQYTVFVGGIPDIVQEFLESHPAADALIVPTEKFAQTRKNLETAGTAEAILYKKIKETL